MLNASLGNLNSYIDSVESELKESKLNFEIAGHKSHHADVEALNAEDIQRLANDSPSEIEPFLDR